jgi:hypothetical protein
MYDVRAIKRSWNLFTLPEEDITVVLGHEGADERASRGNQNCL